MAGDTDSEGTFCCGLPNPFNVFKKKTEEPDPIRQAVDENNVEHRRNRVLIDDEGHPIDNQGRPIQGSILHHREEVGGDTPRIASLLAPPANLYGQAIPMDVLTPPSSAGGASGAGAGPAPAGAFGGGSAAGPARGGSRPISVFVGGQFAAGPHPAGVPGDGPSSASEAPVSKGKETNVAAEKQDAGGGNIAAAANLI
ncbi:uncharacterized protein FIESC28_03730 [Fusarium coffeatum]|uniref:Uncharacterized protein n=1 Tax=Fusarium coffeatum TaxID=231269 RepID=A0A366S3V0_9HYPO|nr:uncharacterized protein FIESC28_03730 [Fusarium coffeatum]RBR23548.1 hypothetical protein FIESC28_03730 [Fusarium coffeatum]